MKSLIPGKVAVGALVDVGVGKAGSVDDDDGDKVLKEVRVTV